MVTDPDGKKRYLSVDDAIGQEFAHSRLKPNEDPYNLSKRHRHKNKCMNCGASTGISWLKSLE